MDKKEKPIEPVSPKDIRKHVPFIILSEAGTAERKIKRSHKKDEKFNNIEKIVFKCQPKSRDSNHITMDNVAKNTPVKEIVYRLIVNNKGKMKLGDIVDRTLEILKGRKISGIRDSSEIHMYFYKLLKEDTQYSFEEIE